MIVIYHRAFGLLYNTKALQLGGYLGNVEVYIGQDPCMLSYLLPAECIQGAHNPVLSGFFYLLFRALLYFPQHLPKLPV